MNKLLSITPVMSEKAYGQSKSGTYTFKVPRDATKLDVSKAVADQFKVEVVSVNMTVNKGKTKRTVYKRSRGVIGQRSDVKKAYVSLKAGAHIPVFAAVEEAEDKEKAAAAKEKK